jgi:hypothetical protein
VGQWNPGTGRSIHSQERENSELGKSFAIETSRRHHDGGLGSLSRHVGRRTSRKEEKARTIGFFYDCLRLGWIKTNPAVSLGRIRADGPPTDYFPKHEFEQIIDATYINQPKGWLSAEIKRPDSGF